MEEVTVWEAKLQFQILRSDRKKIAIQILPNGEVLVRAPYHVPQTMIDALVREQSEWILRSQKRMRMQNAVREQLPPLSQQDIQRLADQALKVIPKRVAFFAERLGVTYQKITIRNQRGRWGSCSAEGNLNFNCLLMLAPPSVLDYVIVHELCHRKELNHSTAFWNEVQAVLPNYKNEYRWLKENGGDLIARMKNGASSLSV